MMRTVKLAIAGLLAAILQGLMLLASSASNQSPQGDAESLFRRSISFGFLLFGRQRCAVTPQACRADTEHSA